LRIRFAFVFRGIRKDVAEDLIQPPATLLGGL
jgi:hypothetical protein